MNRRRHGADVAYIAQHTTRYAVHRLYFMSVRKWSRDFILQRQEM